MLDLVTIPDVTGNGDSEVFSFEDDGSGFLKKNLVRLTVGRGPNPLARRTKVEREYIRCVNSHYALDVFRFYRLRALAFKRRDCGLVIESRPRLLRSSEHSTNYD